MFLVGCAYSIDITICKWVMHYEMLMYAVHRERSVELPTLTLTLTLTFFTYFRFFPLPLVFSNILNTLKITNHRKTFDHIIQYSKPHLIIRFKEVTDYTM